MAQFFPAIRLLPGIQANANTKPLAMPKRKSSSESTGSALRKGNLKSRRVEGKTISTSQTCPHDDTEKVKGEQLNKHGAKRHCCSICDYRCKQKGNLKRHLAHVHNVDVKWHHCDYCDYQCKQKGGLKQHLANVHNVDVNWHHCDFCDYRCKQKGNSKTHLANMHMVDVK